MPEDDDDDFIMARVTISEWGVEGHFLNHVYRNTAGQLVRESYSKKHDGKFMIPVFIGEAVRGIYWLEPGLTISDEFVNDWLDANCGSPYSVGKGAAWFSDEAEAVSFKLWRDSIGKIPLELDSWK